MFSDVLIPLNPSKNHSVHEKRTSTAFIQKFPVKTG